MQTSKKRNCKRGGFTLIELVIVVLVLGILASVAAPKMFNTAGDARDSGTRQSLVVMRDAIELYRAQNGSYPSGASQAAFLTVLKDFIKGPFPMCHVGNTNADVFISSANPITVGGTGQGWAYNATTGEFVINHADGIAW